MIGSLRKELRKLRIDHDHTLKDMGAAIGYSISMICEVEKGRKRPPETLADRLTHAYGLSDEQSERFRQLIDEARRAGDV